MQIAGNWRLREQRYRLQGFRQPNGRMGLQRRRPIAAQRQHPAPAMLEQEPAWASK